MLWPFPGRLRPAGIPVLGGQESSRASIHRPRQGCGSRDPRGRGGVRMGSPRREGCWASSELWLKLYSCTYVFATRSQVHLPDVCCLVSSDGRIKR